MREREWQSLRLQEGNDHNEELKCEYKWQKMQGRLDVMEWNDVRFVERSRAPGFVMLQHWIKLLTFFFFFFLCSRKDSVFLDDPHLVLYIDGCDHIFKKRMIRKSIKLCCYHFIDAPKVLKSKVWISIQKVNLFNGRKYIWQGNAYFLNLI